jgi:hypothetical protein
MLTARSGAADRCRHGRALIFPGVGPACRLAAKGRHVERAAHSVSVSGCAGLLRRVAAVLLGRFGLGRGGRESGDRRTPGSVCVGASER